MSNPLSGSDADIFKHILDQASSDRAENFTKEGGSLDKLNDIAEKALEKADETTKTRIYQNLAAAIKGKDLYYEKSAKGKIFNALRQIPGISKLFRDPRIAAQTKVDSNANYAQQIQNRAHLPEQISLREMKNHYSDQTTSLMRGLSKQMGRVQSLSEQFKSAEWVFNDLMKNLKEGPVTESENFAKLEEAKKENNEAKFNKAIVDLQKEILNKKEELKKYKDALQSSSEPFSDLENEKHRVALQGIIGEGQKIEPYKTAQKSDEKITSFNSKEEILLSEHVESADLSQLGELDFKEITEKMPNLKVIEIDIEQAHSNWHYLMSLPNLEKVVLKGITDYPLTLDLKNEKDSEKAEKLAQLLEKAELKLDNRLKLDSKKLKEILSYAAAVAKLSEYSQNKVMLYRACMNQAAIHLEMENFEAFKSVLLDYFKTPGSKFQNFEDELKDHFNAEKRITYSNLPELVWKGENRHNPVLRVLFQTLPQEGAYAPANDFFYKGMVKSVQAFSSHKEFDKALGDIELFIERQQNNPKAISLHADEWNDMLGQLGYIERSGINVDKQKEMLKEFVKGQDLSDLPSSFKEQILANLKELGASE